MWSLYILGKGEVGSLTREQYSGLFTQMWKPHNFPQGWIALPSFHRWKNRETKRWNNMLKAIQLLRHRNWVWAQVSQTPSLIPFPCTKSLPSVRKRVPEIVLTTPSRALVLSLAIHFPTYLFMDIPVFTMLEEYFACLHIDVATISSHVYFL